MWCDFTASLGSQLPGYLSICTVMLTACQIVNFGIRYLSNKLSHVLKNGVTLDFWAIDLFSVGV